MISKVLPVILISFISCSQKSPVHEPINLSKEEFNTSQNRAKLLNQIEREQITTWINSQNKKFYPTSKNYWSDIGNLEKREKKQDGEIISFQYELFDFDNISFYNQPQIYQNAILGNFEELEAIENTLRYLYKGEEATLLVPSILAYGTYGDGKDIPNDMPLVIKLKRL